jgi:hypothetical protein
MSLLFIKAMTQTLEIIPGAKMTQSYEFLNKYSNLKP